MRQHSHSLPARLARFTRRRLRKGWLVLRVRGPSQAQFWVLALLVGTAAGFAALFFRKGIEALQATLYGTERLLAAGLAGRLDPVLVVGLPVLGGLVVGLILHRFTPDGRVRSVADVIEGAALSEGRVEKRAGLASAAASLITLSSGGSSGREGPVVHLAGVISSWIADRIRADGITGRDLLGCAVAGAVSASFNAPIAGAIFALEVVLRHYAIHSFAPIAIASVAGTVINRLEYGGVTEFILPSGNELAFYGELPAFLLLGLVCGLVAVMMMKSCFWAEDAATAIQDRLRLPRWLRPAGAGLLLGLIALQFPHVIGVGYEVTTLALTGQLTLGAAIVFAVVKVVAVAITLGGRMGGGVFSPALVVGALTGLAFGLIATQVLPEQSGSETLYALAGMGAVAAAVLGAPISTTLIVFELTGDWQTGIAVMTAVSLASAVSSRLVAQSYFLTQLARRGVDLARGAQTWLLRARPVGQLMVPPDAPGVPDAAVLRAMAQAGRSLTPAASLETALRVFERTGETVLPVIGGGRQPQELEGAVFQLDVLRAYARALAARAAEEHG